MKAKNLLISILYAVIPFSLLISQDNFLDDFEDGNIDGWTVIEGNSSISTEQSHSGSYSLKGWGTFPGSKVIRDNFSANSGTYEAWFRPSGSVADGVMYFQFIDNANYYCVYLRPIGGDSPELRIDKRVDGTETILTTIPATFNMYNWIKLTVDRFDNGDIKIYIDDDLQISINDSDITESGSYIVAGWDTYYVDDISYQNNNNQSLFTKITIGNIVTDGGDSDGCAWGDYDNDGDMDLFVSNRLGQNNFMYSNNGDGTFTSILDGAFVNDGGDSRGISWGDYDNDNNVDLFVATAVFQNNFLYHSDGEPTYNFTKITNGSIVNEGGNTHGCSWGDYNNDGNLDMFVANWDNQNNFMFLNDGPPNYIFTQITDGDIVNGNAYSGSVSWCDYDKDGYIDLFVANVHNNENNNLYHNDGPPNFTFTKITGGDIVNNGGASLGSHWGDYDNDGDFDLFVTNRNQNNFLYKNNGDGTFTKITTGVVLSNVGDSHACNWIDYDNDGDLDLFISNAGQNNVLYMNNGNETFTQVTDDIVVSDGGNSHGSSWSDYDNDGDLDLFVANVLGGNNFLYRNNGNSNNWINLQCIGTISNTSAIGAIIKTKALIDGIPVWQMRQITGQTGWSSQNSLNVEFGFGDATVIDSIKIEWPRGIVQVLTDVDVNQFLTIEESTTNTNNHKELLDGLILYPNPTSGVVNFSIPLDWKKMDVSILNVYGALIYSGEIYKGSSLDMSFLNSGLYYVIVNTGQNKSTKKIIIKP